MILQRYQSRSEDEERVSKDSGEAEVITVASKGSSNNPDESLFFDKIFSYFADKEEVRKIILCWKIVRTSVCAYAYSYI